MKNSFNYSSLALFIGCLLVSCDSTVNPIDKLQQAPTINSLSINPQEINFTPSDGFKDTTIILLISANIDNVNPETTLGFVIRDKITSNLLEDGKLVLDNGTNLYNSEINIETTTTSFEDFLVEVYAYNKDGNGNFFQRNLSIDGFSNDPPVLIEVNNPEEVIIPSEGELVIPFTAKVFDPDGQENIDRVLIEFINEDGTSLIPASNQLFDNGLNEDLASGDSVYTIAFRINSGNTPNNRRAIYFAIDKAGLYSDTLETVFNIVEE